MTSRQLSDLRDKVIADKPMDLFLKADLVEALTELINVRMALESCMFFKANP